MKINADGLPYRELNEAIHAALRNDTRALTLENVRGQRYIGAGLEGGVRLTINGVPGNDLAAFMNGAEILVNGNAQDGVGNTMNAGKVVVHGHAGDVLGYAMRGGKIFVRGRVGYRTGIHMKAYLDRAPIVVVGATARDYLGEYMAGGILTVLNLDGDGSPAGEYVGTGMHGGVIYLRGNVEAHQLGREVGVDEISDVDWNALKRILDEYCADFALNASTLRRGDFTKFIPVSSRPYGKLYAY